MTQDQCSGMAAGGSDEVVRGRWRSVLPRRAVCSLRDSRREPPDARQRLGRCRSLRPPPSARPLPSVCLRRLPPCRMPCLQGDHAASVWKRPLTSHPATTAATGPIQPPLTRPRRPPNYLSVAPESCRREGRAAGGFAISQAPLLVCRAAPRRAWSGRGECRDNGAVASAGRSPWRAPWRALGGPGRIARPPQPGDGRSQSTPPRRPPDGKIIQPAPRTAT